jgi:hypothetical protein
MQRECSPYSNALEADHTDAVCMKRVAVFALAGMPLDGGWTGYGGEGGIRTPDTLTGMPDFESGAFNRALPPLRIAKLIILLTLQHRSVLQVSGESRRCPIWCPFRFCGSPGAPWPKPGARERDGSSALPFGASCARAGLRRCANPPRPSRVYWQKYGGCNARCTLRSRPLLWPLDRRVKATDSSSCRSGQ